MKQSGGVSLWFTLQQNMQPVTREVLKRGMFISVEGRIRLPVILIVIQCGFSIKVKTHTIWLLRLRFIFPSKQRLSSESISEPQ